MTIPEASRLVLQAQAIGTPGDIFVLEMGEPVKIVDLARKMIALSGVPADITHVGLRPGEKLHEELITETERLMPTEREKIQRVVQVAVPEPGFAQDIRALTRLAGEGDLDGLFELIERLEPGFALRDSAQP
jgi:FlaA1/EpsC-like NDP-sugar epimerase